MNIAGLEVVGIASIINHIEVTVLSGGLGISIGSEYAFRLVAIEQAYRMADTGKDVVVAIHRRGVIATGQRLNLILIVAHGCTKLEMPVTTHDGFAREGELKARVLKRTAIGSNTC